MENKLTEEEKEILKKLPRVPFFNLAEEEIEVDPHGTPPSAEDYILYMWDEPIETKPKKIAGELYLAAYLESKGENIGLFRLVASLLKGYRMHRGQGNVWSSIEDIEGSEVFAEALFGKENVSEELRKRKEKWGGMSSPISASSLALSQAEEFFPALERVYGMKGERVLLLGFKGLFLLWQMLKDERKQVQYLSMAEGKDRELLERILPPWIEGLWKSRGVDLVEGTLLALSFAVPYTALRLQSFGGEEFPEVGKIMIASIYDGLVSLEEIPATVERYIPEELKDVSLVLREINSLKEKGNGKEMV